MAGCCVSLFAFFYGVEDLFCCMYGGKCWLTVSSRSEEGEASSMRGSITGVLQLAYKRLGLNFEGRPVD